MEEPAKQIYAVSHSNLLQCGVAIFEIQNAVAEEAKNPNFDFGQNAWTLELKVAKSATQAPIQVTNLYNGIPKPEPNRARGAQGKEKTQGYFASKLGWSKEEDPAKMETRLMLQRLYANSPSTISKEDGECRYDAGALNPFPTYGNLNPEIEDDEDDDEGDSVGGGLKKAYIRLNTFKKMKKPCFASAESIQASPKTMMGYANAKPPPPPVLIKSNLNFIINISRHGNSCNNIVPDKGIKLATNLTDKKSDPSLSTFGVWSLTEKNDAAYPFPKKLTQLFEQRTSSDPVYVSCCIRTWETALLIYGGKPPEGTPPLPLTLIVSPYLKEKGGYSGNMPESLTLQRNKIQNWIKRHPIPVPLIIKLAFVDGPDVEIYPTLTPNAAYSNDHLTYFKDGIPQFCKWVVARNQSGVDAGISAPNAISLGGSRRASSSFSSRRARRARRSRRSRRVFRRGGTSRRVRQR